MKEDEKNPIPTNSKPSLPKIYENTILLKNRVEAKIIDCNLKSKYKNMRSVENDERLIKSVYSYT